MKKTLRTLMMGMMALLACNALISCSNDDEPQVAQQEGQKGYVEFTLTRGADTRITYEATSEGGLDAFWSEGDKMVIFYNALTDEEIVEVFDLVEGAGTKTARFAKSDSQLADKSADGIEIVYLPNYDVNKSISENLFDFSIQDGTLEGLGKYDRFTFNAKLTEGKIELFDYDSFEPVMLILHFPTDIDFGTGTGTTTSDFVFSGGVNKQVPYDSPTLGDITVKGVSLTNGKLDEDLYVAAWSVPPTSLSVGGLTYSLPYGFDPGTVYTFVQENLFLAPAVGVVIGSDGKYYATASAVPAGVKAEAMIAYLGDEAEGAEHGLAIALEDANDGATWNNSGSSNNGMTAAEIVADWASNHTVTDGTWRLPSAYDWQRMLIGCGSSSTYTEPLDPFQTLDFGYGNFKTMLMNATGKSADEAELYYFWTSTEDTTRAWYYSFYSSKFSPEDKGNLNFVRAVLAF